MKAVLGRWLKRGLAAWLLLTLGLATYVYCSGRRYFSTAPQPTCVGLLAEQPPGVARELRDHLWYSDP